MENVKKGEFLVLNKDVCEYLESLNLSYKEMVEYFGIKVYPDTIRKAFWRYQVKHKTKKVMIKQYCIENPTKSLSFVAIKYKCSREWVKQIRKEIKDEIGRNI